MSNALLSIRTDDKTKQEIANFAASLGLSVSAFATVVLKQAVRDGRIVLTAPIEPTPYLEKLMQETESDLAAGKNMTPAMDAKEAIAYLDSL
jgi:antitoxin component of RelBE/YafQ-DinJ toxin-antitoxin module